MTTTSTIFALSTAPGRAGVAVIRISGPEAQACVATMAGPLPAPRQIALRTIRDWKTAEALDRAVVFWMAGPKSETGEDLAEFQLHGGPAIVRAVLAALAQRPGCRMAEPGEFTRRALVNGRIDLAEVEGLGDLIHADTDAQRRQALRLASGAASHQYEAWRSALIEAAALVEASIDFSDEADVASASYQGARERVVQLAADLSAHLDDGHRGEIVRDGFRVALMGPPNAGKSSLLNALARRDVAIVSDEAGTTRDLIEVRLDLAGVPVVLTDTAGLRAATGAIEREGIRRSLEAGRSAHLILWLTETGEPPAAESLAPGISRETILVIRSKIDLARADSAAQTSRAPARPTPARPIADCAISALTGAGLTELISDLARRATDAAGDGSSAVVSQVRHRAHLDAALAGLNAFLAGRDDDIELRAEDLRRAAAELGRITGRVDPEDVLDRIFSSFCIGK